MNDRRNGKLILAVALLSLLPIFVGITWTYTWFTPRQFYASIVIEVRWEKVDGNAFKAALDEFVISRGRNEVLIHSVQSSTGAQNPEYTLYRIGVFHTSADQAAISATLFWRELDKRFNESYFKKPVPISTEYQPIRLWQQPELPLAPARPNVLPVMMFGATSGVISTLIGLFLTLQTLRPRRSAVDESRVRQTTRRFDIQLRYTASAALLLHLPAFIAIAWTYSTFAPREFYSEIAIEVYWDKVDSKGWKAGIRDLAWNNRPDKIVSRRLMEHDTPNSAVYGIGVFKPTGEDAAREAGYLYRWIDDRFNQIFSEGLQDWQRIKAAKVLKEPQVPVAPARPNVSKVMLLGKVLGATFALIGLILFFHTFRPEQPQSDGTGAPS